MSTPLYGKNSSRLESVCCKNNSNSIKEFNPLEKIKSSVQEMLDNQHMLTPNSRLYLKGMSFCVKQLHLVSEDQDNHNSEPSLRKIYHDINHDDSTSDLERDDLEFDNLEKLEATTDGCDDLSKYTDEDSFVEAFGEGLELNQKHPLTQGECASLSLEDLGYHEEDFDSDDSDYEGPQRTQSPLDIKGPTRKGVQLEIKEQDDRVGAVFSLVIRGKNEEDQIFFAYTKRKLSTRLREIDRRAHGDAKNKTPMEQALAEADKVAIFVLYTKQDLKDTKLCKARTALSKLVSPYKNKNVLNCWKQLPPSNVIAIVE